MSKQLPKALEGDFMLAFGTGSTWRKEDPEAVDLKLVDVIKYALQAGYRHLDTAELYNTEKEVGEAIEQSGIPASEIYLTAKVSNMSDIQGAFARTLERLKVDYVDMYLLHYPYFTDSPTELQAAWAELETIHDTGKAGAIGVSNFTQPHLQTIVKTARIKPALNQIELNPYLQRRELQNFHKAQGIRTMAYSPLSPIVRASPGPLDTLLESLASRFGISTAVVLISWAFQQGVGVVTTSTVKDRMRDHLLALKIPLRSEDVDQISKIGAEKHFRGRWNDKISAEDRR